MPEYKFDYRAGAAWSLGSVAGAVLWKKHRVWGFILGGMAAGAAWTLITGTPVSTVTT